MAERIYIDPWPDLGNTSVGIIWKYFYFCILILVCPSGHFYFYKEKKYERKEIFS